MIHRLKTEEALRLAAARWLLAHDIKNICCFGNILGERFIESFELPVSDGKLFETYVDAGENITLIFENKICLRADATVSGRAEAFVYLRYVRALYDDNGNIYSYVTMGYCW